jgi:hypothetical protein
MRPFYLDAVPPVPVASLHPLSSKTWLASQKAWSQGIQRAGDTTALLSAAFDGMLDTAVLAASNGNRHHNRAFKDGSNGKNRCDDGDDNDNDNDNENDDDDDVHNAVTCGGFISTDAIEEVDYEEEADVLLPASVSLTFNTLVDDLHCASVTEDALNDDDDAVSIDIHTGLAASDIACPDDNDDDDDMESIDGDTEEESIDDDDDDDDDDEDDVA